MGLFSLWTSGKPYKREGGIRDEDRSFAGGAVEDELALENSRLLIALNSTRTL